jgi:hypothetical protein
VASEVGRKKGSAGIGGRAGRSPRRGLALTDAPEAPEKACAGAEGAAAYLGQAAAAAAGTHHLPKEACAKRKRPQRQTRQQRCLAVMVGAGCAWTSVGRVR